MPNNMHFTAKRNWRPPVIKKTSVATAAVIFLLLVCFLVFAGWIDAVSPNPSFQPYHVHFHGIYIYIHIYILGIVNKILLIIIRKFTNFM